MKLNCHLQRMMYFMSIIQCFVEFPANGGHGNLTNMDVVYSVASFLVK